MRIVEIIEIENELGIILPEDIIEKLNLRGRDHIRDHVNAVEIPNGVRLIPNPSEPCKTSEVADDNNAR